MCTFQVVHHHGLRVVSLDVDIDTMAPKVDLLESVITGRTVALLLAHIYGKWFDTRPFLEIAKKHNIKVIVINYFLLKCKIYQLQSCDEKWAQNFKSHL